jgi:hypothetical protein
VQARFLEAFAMTNQTPLPCSRCGKNASLRSSSDGDVEWVQCKDCGCKGPLHYSALKAIEAWNTRPQPPAAPSTANEVAHYLSDRFEWAAPGDQQEDAWIVRFCDNDVRDMLFTGPDAEREAWEAWNKHAPGYNIYVFQLAHLQSRASTANEEEAVAQRRYITLWRNPERVLDWDFHVSENDHEVKEVIRNLRKRGTIKQGTTYVLANEMPELSPVAALTKGAEHVS